MKTQFNQPQGSTSRETNKEAIARVYGIKKSDVAYVNNGLIVDDYKILYDKATQTSYYVGNATGNIQSWSVTSKYISITTNFGVFPCFKASVSKGIIPTISDLRNLRFDEVDQTVEVFEHTVDQNSGGGIWYCYSLNNPNSLIDDNGCQIINNYGQVIRRKDVKSLYSDMFGLVPGGDFDSVIQNMFKASRTFNIEEAWICHMGRDNPKPRSNGGNVFDLSDGMSFYVKGVGGGRFGASIVHAGNNICMRFRRDYNTSKEFWISGGVEGLRIVGQGDSFSGTNSYVNATAIEISDLWGANLNHIFISGYTGNSSGSAISLYNETGWTEGTELNDIVIRQSVNGLWLHRNPVSGSGATDSFFKTVGNLDINAGVSGTAINFIKIGDGTSAGKCLLYGHDIMLTGWMSNGSWHNGILVTNYSTCLNGKFRLNFDGYGISSSASSEVIHLIRLGGSESLFDCDVVNTSGQTDGYPLSMLKLLMNSCVYLDDSTVFDSSIIKGRPLVRAKGLTVRYTGTFTQAECISGMSYQLNGLVPGTKLKVTLRSWGNNSKYEAVTQYWDVEVRGTDLPCIVKPTLASGTSLTTSNVSGGVINGVTTAKAQFMQTASTSADAVTQVNTTTANALASATLTTSQLQINSTFNTSLTLTNGQANNGISYAANSGRKINIVLPADADATQPMPYTVEIEVL
ncbi:tail fiber protein [Serratia phage vB_Sru_IME250]|uniref:Tail fibers protein n=1 Tax=Serratia phage vB_Sru_IME250 TaxID=1852640 RepID=A0A1J0MGQ6_9CAUD|nr:tail fiber protein [Serratia phage vB_Sru_IME250]ANM47214.1 tail fibers protein [Serratia phage vB_Sru_IME250]APD20122.1 tail fibers protein [Serratia phage vB_Sru_IME250]